jgi:putative DeoR family transcriptional regulator (stage III sporulation protein D)
VRGAAAYFGLSKSTVHKDVTKRLKSVNPPLFSAVSEVLAKNKAERHIRGGQATKTMYLNKKKETFSSYSSNSTK